jgi:hypothetical protein
VHLQALNAEIVFTFEGTNEGGDQFMARQSYLPGTGRCVAKHLWSYMVLMYPWRTGEIHWGFVFVPIILKARPGSTRHVIDLSRHVALHQSVCHHQSMHPKRERENVVSHHKLNI